MSNREIIALNVRSSLNRNSEEASKIEANLLRIGCRGVFKVFSFREGALVTDYVSYVERYLRQYEHNENSREFAARLIVAPCTTGLEGLSGVGVWAIPDELAVEQAVQEQQAEIVIPPDRQPRTLKALAMF